jgi:hypothetical protein
VKNRHLALAIGVFITGIFFFLSSCKKINEATELGSGLIPPVDNITTFDTNLTIEAYNGLFTIGGTDPLNEDSVRSSYTDEQFLGLITNDPLFGKTDARMFFELKPPTYPYGFINKPDSLNIDSVVLILNYLETYGDTTAPQTINVYEINQSSDFRVDTAYLLRKNDISYTNLLGSRTFKPEVLNDSIKAYKDTTANQLRIRLSDAFGQRLLNFDSTANSGAYFNDSIFRTKFKGFALQSTSGNAVMGFSLTGANTKLAIYYKDDNNNAPVAQWDTAVAYFAFKASATYGLIGSSAANLVQRDYSTGEIAGAQNGTTPDPYVYIQNTPGSFARLKVPALGSLKNMVVHRAEVIAEQAWHSSDTIFRPPPYMYLDAYDPSLSAYLMIPYDLTFDQTGNLNFNTFGIAPVNALDGAGHVIKSWHFNVTRYVQHVVNNTDTAFDLRLTSPFFLFDKYRLAPGGTVSTHGISINPTTTKGRVRLWGNGGDADPNTQRLRLRIVYSKL